MSLLNLEQISKEYQARWVRGSFATRAGRYLKGDRRDGRRVVLDNVSLEINEGERWGLLGPNGSGKTTLLKIIAGILRPSSGIVRVQGKVTPFFSWYVGFLDDLDAYENIFLYGSLFGLTRHEIKGKLDAILSFAGLEPFLYEKLRTYSTGMKARLAFAIGMQTNANLFLFDEIFSVGDKAFQEKCADAIRESSKNGRAVILASHDNQLINDITKKCLLLEHGKPISCGPTADVLATYGGRG